jgi:hypothetical protein
LSAARIGDGKIDFAKLMADCRAAVHPEALARLAVSLGVSAESLTRLGVGWSMKHRGWTFPMADASRKVLGVRLRMPSGRKLSITGGKDGLLVPEGVDTHGLLLIAEGPTDTAALLDLGFAAVGRPSCRGGVRLLVDLVRQHHVSEVVIVSDNDTTDNKMAGQRGAANLASALVAYCPAVRVIAPPTGFKDAREWKRRGATAADVQAAIDVAPVRRLAIETAVHKQKARGQHGR